MFEHFIAQKEEICERCQAEIPRGAWAWFEVENNTDGRVFCEDCGNGGIEEILE